MTSSLQSSNSPVENVRIWTAHLDEVSEEETAQLYSYLNASERERAARFHFERDRKNFVAARGFLRDLLGEVLNTPPSALIFDYGERGKPTLRQAAAIHFNLSHSAGWAMYAVAEREIGIDLESAERIERDEANLDRLAARVLSRREVEFWRTIPELAARRAMFLRAWTRKEACVKATGHGVFDSFARVEVIPEVGKALTSDWLIRDLEAPEGFAAALALRRVSEVVERGAAVFAAGSDA